MRVKKKNLDEERDVTELDGFIEKDSKVHYIVSPYLVTLLMIY